LKLMESEPANKNRLIVHVVRGVFMERSKKGGGGAVFWETYLVILVMSVVAGKQEPVNK